MTFPKAHVAEQPRGIPAYLDAVKKAFLGEADPIKLDCLQRDGVDIQ